MIHYSVPLDLTEPRLFPNDRDGFIITYLEVATAESTVLNVEFSTTQLRGQQLVAAVTLVKALGGGWQETMKQ